METQTAPGEVETQTAPGEVETQTAPDEVDEHSAEYWAEHEEELVRWGELGEWTQLMTTHHGVGKDELRRFYKDALIRRSLAIDEQAKAGFLQSVMSDQAPQGRLTFEQRAARMALKQVDDAPWLCQSIFEFAKQNRPRGTAMIDFFTEVAGRVESINQTPIWPADDLARPEWLVAFSELEQAQIIDTLQTQGIGPCRRLLNVVKESEVGPEGLPGGGQQVTSIVL
jgi:hypothetical protein